MIGNPVNPEMSQVAYDHYTSVFLPLVKKGLVNIPNERFSDSSVLDCLEQEIDSTKLLVKKILSVTTEVSPNILIVGAGSGRLATELFTQAPHIKVTEVDKNKVVVERLMHKQKKNKERTAVHATAENLPFPDKSFDVVIIYSVFRYIDRYKEALKELLRVTTDKGHLIISEAKDEKTFSAVLKDVRSLKVSFNLAKEVFSNVRLPHLTFFYYLLSTAVSYPEIKKEIHKIMQKKGMAFNEAVFSFAGSSLGDIHVAVITKGKHD